MSLVKGFLYDLDDTGSDISESTITEHQFNGHELLARSSTLMLFSHFRLELMPDQILPGIDQGKIDIWLLYYCASVV